MRLSRILSLLLFMLAGIPAGAQDMVRDGGSDGLMKTVSYDVASFTDIRDKKLSDVMMKMPGVSGSTMGGSIYFSFNGMDVDKIYVNGADVLEGNSQPVYNLKPEDVDRLEITENHVSIYVMRGKTYSNKVSINVVMKDSAKGRWSGSVKAMAGAAPVLGTADVNALNLGPKAQTTVMFKADNTGLDFSGPLHGYGDYGEPGDFFNEDSYAGSEGVSGGFDYNIRKFLDVEPNLAPLSSERVRFNKSAVAQVGSTFALPRDYQLNVQMTLHANGLHARSMDETTYYMENGSGVVYTGSEDAAMRQYDIQTSATLLSNTARRFVRNQLIFNHRRIGMLKEITGSDPNTHDMRTNPIYLKDDFHIKRRIGDNVLSVNMMTGYNTRPQRLLMSRFDPLQMKDRVMDQYVDARSAYIDMGGRYDISVTDGLNISVNAGTAYNGRNTWIQLSGAGKLDSEVDDDLGILNLFGGFSMTYVTDRLQTKIDLPVVYGRYRWQEMMGGAAPLTALVLCISPKADVKYDLSGRLSVSASASLNRNPVDRKRIYSGAVVKDFMEAMEGYPEISKDRSFDSNIQVTYRNPEKSFFVNGSASFSGYGDAFLSIMKDNVDQMVSSYLPRPQGYRGRWGNEKLDVSRGISSFKGKVGISVSADQSSSFMVRGESLLPFSTSSVTFSPYLNGRLSKWCNMVYRLDFVRNAMQMSDYERTNTQSCQQSLELIFSPWDRFNFSLLGEHYYTQFSEDMSKHLVLVDFKAEYDVNDRWQLLLTATNILNQDTYNYTLVDSERFVRSFTSYSIRPVNVLLGAFFKF